MKQTIEQTVAAVQNAPGSIYTKQESCLVTKQDVIALLQNLELTQDKTVKLTEEQIEQLCSDLVACIKTNVEDLSFDSSVDTHSAQFNLNGNEIELESVDLDTDYIASNVVDGIDEVLTDFFEELAGSKQSKS